MTGDTCCTADSAVQVDAILLKHASLMDAAKNLADNNKEDEVISLRLV